MTQLCLKDNDSMVIPLVWYQEATERLLMCQKCQDTWIDFLPVTMPLHQVECEVCLTKGQVTQGAIRRK